MPRKLLHNWITAYGNAMSPITEAPDAFTVWSAISVVSSVLKKHVWISRGTYKIYPNQYIVLVGPPGVGKGTAIHPAHNHIKALKPPPANYLSDRITAPEIIERLAKGFPVLNVIGGQVVPSNESTATIMASELSTFLGSSDWMTGFLCDTWDRDEFNYGTKNKGSSAITNMCVSIIGACVPDFIRKINGKTNSSEAINSGFTARTIFVFANEKSKKLPWPTKLEDTKGGLQFISDLRHDLLEISKIKGEYSFTPDAIDAFSYWYKNAKTSDNDSDVVRHFKSRQDVHIFKVAMCFAAAYNDNLVIDRLVMQTAIHLVQNILNTLDITFRGVGESSLAEATAKVQNFIERKGVVTRAELIGAMARHATMEDIDRIIVTLHTIGIIKPFTTSGSGARQFYQYVQPTMKGTSNGSGVGVGVTSNNP